MKQPDELILLGNMDGFESANRVYSGGVFLTQPIQNQRPEGQEFKTMGGYVRQFKQQEN